MPSSGMLRRVDLVRTDVSEECSASDIRVTRIGELGTLAVTNKGRALRRNTEHCSYTFPILIITVSVQFIPQDGVRVNLISGCN
jgi:hypothetical protein